jgi:hypothetical protein
MGMFFGFHYLYLFCQKDSTDPRDASNLFIKRGWRTASLICIGFGIIASAFFLPLATSTALLAVWVQNALSKVINLYSIYTRNVTRTLRTRVILSEFVTPYLYLGGAFLG